MSDSSSSAITVLVPHAIEGSLPDAYQPLVYDDHLDNFDAIGKGLTHLYNYDGFNADSKALTFTLADGEPLLYYTIHHTFRLKS